MSVIAYDLIEEEFHSEGDKMYEEDPIHIWFELSYAQYLTIPRSVLQSMSYEWQKRFVKCLEELDESFNWRPEEGRYWVRLKDGEGRFIRDPLMEYRHQIFKTKDCRYE